MNSDTPKTDKLFFPHGRDATAAAEPSLLVCMTQYELLERENAAQLAELHRISEALGTNEGHSSVTHIEILKKENAALRDWGEPVAWCWMDEEIGFGLPPDAVSQEATLLYAKKEEGK